MVERKVEWKYVLIASVITILMLLSLFYAGYKFNQYKVGSLESKVNDIEASQRSVDLTYELSRELDGGCERVKDVRSSTLSEIRELRGQMKAYEQSERIENDRYESIKKMYMNAVIQNMVDLGRIEEKCGKNYTDIIYFYSNEDCDACEDQGTILGVLRGNDEERIRVHPLDTDLEMNSISYLENYYNITRYPSIVVEGEAYHGFQSKDKLNELIEENQDNFKLNRTQQ